MIPSELTPALDKRTQTIDAIREAAEQADTAYTEARTKFIADLQWNAQHTLSWRADDLIQAEYVAKFYERVLAMADAVQEEGRGWDLFDVYAVTIRDEATQVARSFHDARHDFAEAALQRARGAFVHDEYRFWVAITTSEFIAHGAFLQREENRKREEKRAQEAAAAEAKREAEKAAKKAARAAERKAAREAAKH